jgi:3-demethoxyubiquinol 3-hydroxylase
MPSRRRPLPGEPVGSKLAERVLRVDHAGEYGAKRIYEGQLAVLGDGPAAEAIREMAAAEAEHLAWFDKELVARRVRPTALHPFWHVAGYALGAATALMGPKAAMACTVAVEEVIDEHYQRQIETLGADEAALKATLIEFRDDEIEHRDTARDSGGDNAPPLLSAAIKAGSRLAIWLSTRI